MRVFTISLLMALAVGVGLPIDLASAQHPRSPPISPSPIAEPSLQCRQAIAATERGAAIPSHLMAAIARIESGRPDGRGGVSPWPWTINVEGAGYFYNSKAEAIAAVRDFQARGARSIDVGCMQVNLMFHPTAFASLDEAFDPLANARYAAKFLNTLYDQTHDWTKATAFYHSATPALGTPYQRKVFAVLPDEQRLRLAAGPAGASNVWSNNVWTNNVWNTRGPAWPTEGGQPRPAVAPSTGGYMLSNRADTARTLPAPPGTAGRGLNAYRGAPVPLATRQLGAARL